MASGTALRYDDAKATDKVSYAVFRLSSVAISVGGLSSLSIDHVDFWQNTTAIEVDPLPWVPSPYPCVPPYTAKVEATDSWWYPGGHPGFSGDPAAYLGLTVPAQFQAAYAASVTQLQQVAAVDPTQLQSDNDSWALYACPSLPVAFPWFPVDVRDRASQPNFAFLPRPAIAH